MGSHSFAFLPFDYTRCQGEGCTERERCARYKQIEKDKEVTEPYRGSYTATLIDRETDRCTMRIELT